MIGWFSDLHFTLLCSSTVGIKSLPSHMLGIVDLICLFSRQKISPNTCSCSLMLSYSSKWAGLVSPPLIPVAGQSKWMCHVLCGIKGKVVHSSFRSCCFVQFLFFVFWLSVFQYFCFFNINVPFSFSSLSDG